MIKHQQRQRTGKVPGRARGRQSRHKGTWMLKSSFMFLRVKRMAPCQHFSRRTVACQESFWLRSGGLSFVCNSGKTRRLGSTREVKSAAGTDFSGRVRVARASNAGRPRRTRSAAWFLSAPASGSHRLRLPAGHQPFRIDLRPTGALQGCKAHLLFIFPILGTQQLSGSRSLVYLPRKQKNVWTSSCNDAALCESVLPCRHAMAPSGGYHYPHTRIVCYGQMGSGHNNQICHKFCDLFSSLLHSNCFQSFCFCWENFAIPLKSNFSMDCEMQYSRAIYK